MKIKLASVLGLAVLLMSFVFGSSLVYADAEETSSAIETLAAVATSDEGGLSCILDSAGADICTVVAKVAELDQPAAAGETEVAATEEAPAIHTADAIVAEVKETVTIAVPGDNAGSSEEPASTGAVSEPAAAEPVAMLDAAATTVASAAPAIGEVDAIVVEVSQTATIAAPGQEAGSSEEPATTGSIAAPPAAAPAVDANDPNDLDD
jgi:hypothetical protein